MVLRSRRHQVLFLWLILFLCILEHGHGSRATNVFKFKAKSQHTGHFFGFLPRRIPIPYSSPSKKHNDLGLQIQ
ncbi:Protein IDA-LIKE 4, partial [Mucuna pruriens]